jgi:MATE family multidrug resistance protein
MKKLPLKEVFTFSLPLIAGQVGQMLFGVGDILVASRYSNEVLSALGIAVAIFSPFLVAGLGVTFAVGPITARLKGEGSQENDMLASSLLISLCVGTLLFIALMAFAEYGLGYLNLLDALVKPIKIYLQTSAISLYFLLFFQVYKEYLQAYGDTFFANGTILFFNVTNVLLNIVLMFGLGPFAEMGIKGAAIATVINRLGMAIVLAVYTHIKRKPEYVVTLSRVKEVFALGTPIGLATAMEVLVFSTVTVLVGKMSITASASHNIVLNFVSLTFMVPLALSSAASVFIGEAFGKKEPETIHSYSMAVLILSTGFMLLTALLYFLLPTALMTLATEDQKIIEYGAGLLFYVALFQIPDGIQVALWGILRGMGEANAPMVLGLIANWLIGLPLGIYFANSQQMEAKGLWAGLAIGLYLMSIGLGTIYTLRLKGLKQKFAPLAG